MFSAIIVDLLDQATEDLNKKKLNEWLVSAYRKICEYFERYEETGELDLEQLAEELYSLLEEMKEE
jgi:predicted ArsR family transcriptional regulator